jgi:hypothetical protein
MNTKTMAEFTVREVSNEKHNESKTQMVINDKEIIAETSFKPFTAPGERGLYEKLFDTVKHHISNPPPAPAPSNAGELTYYLMNELENHRHEIRTLNNRLANKSLKSDAGEAETFVVRAISKLRDIYQHDHPGFVFQFGENPPAPAPFGKHQYIKEIINQEIYLGKLKVSNGVGISMRADTLNYKNLDDLKKIYSENQQKKITASEYVEHWVFSGEKKPIPENLKNVRQPAPAPIPEIRAKITRCNRTN